MRAATMVFVMLGACLCRDAIAAPGAPPSGYQFANVSTGLTAAQVGQINQMVFKPGDLTHLYASTGFNSNVMRYNFNSTTGQLSSPTSLLSLSNVSDGMKVITGLGFHGNDMWISRWPGWVVPRPSAVSRMRDVNGDGDFNDVNERSDFVTGLELRDHTINQIQITGNSLYVGIGVQRNNGDPNVEFVYNGTIGRIANLNNPVAMNLSTTADRNLFADSSVTDGRLRRYARGFRNPYGLRITASGQVLASDNGADAEGSFPETPDLFYRDIKLNDVGRFPPPGQPGAPTPTMTPITLPSHAGATGFDFIRTGPQRGNIIVGYSSSNANGRRLAMIDSISGAVSTFMTGFSTPTDVINDPAGRLLISNLDGNAVYMLTPPMDADPNLDRRVDIRDLKVLAMHWNSSADWFNGDFDRSGFVDAKDLSVLALNWQNGTGALSAALTSLGLPADSVPEPSAAIVVLLAVVVAISSRRRVKPIPVAAHRCRYGK